MWGEAKETRSSDKKEDMPSRHVCKDVRPLLEKMTMMTMMTMTMMKKMMMMMMKMNVAGEEQTKVRWWDG